MEQIPEGYVARKYGTEVIVSNGQTLRSDFSGLVGFVGTVMLCLTNRCLLRCPDYRKLNWKNPNRPWWRKLRWPRKNVFITISNDCDTLVTVGNFFFVRFCGTLKRSYDGLCWQEVMTSCLSLKKCGDCVVVYCPVMTYFTFDGDHWAIIKREAGKIVGVTNDQVIALGATVSVFDHRGKLHQSLTTPFPLRKVFRLNGELIGLTGCGTMLVSLCNGQTLPLRMHVRKIVSNDKIAAFLIDGMIIVTSDLATFSVVRGTLIRRLATIDGLFFADGRIFDPTRVIFTVYSFQRSPLWSPWTIDGENIIQRKQGRSVLLSLRRNQVHFVLFLTVMSYV